IELIAEFLGVEAGEQEKKVARLLCGGGKLEAQHKINYQGQETCRALAVVSSGNKACVWGCLGLADCERACTFDAIHMNSNNLPVVDVDKCTACGDCVEICPKDLFVLMPISYKLMVQCKSLLEGEEAENLCAVACNACGRCVADAPPGTMKMEKNLPWIDYSKNDLLNPSIARRCPTGAIVWIEDKQFEKTFHLPLPIGRVEKIVNEDEETL
ncbi:MAG: 4Fe-4S dicluster domain-containing protein, partial [Planctomycetota bacterium]